MNQEELVEALKARIAQDGGESVDQSLVNGIAGILTSVETEVLGVDLVVKYAVTIKKFEIWILTTANWYVLSFSISFTQGFKLNENECQLYPISCATAAWEHENQLVCVGPGPVVVVAAPNIVMSSSTRLHMAGRINSLMQARAQLDASAPIAAFLADSVVRATGANGLRANEAAVVVAYRDRLDIFQQNTAPVTVPLTRIRKIDIGGPGHVVQQKLYSSGTGIGMGFDF